MTSQTSRQIFTVKQVADHVGVHTHSIILAEKEGRIPAARRDELGHRFYDSHDLERIASLMDRNDRE